MGVNLGLQRFVSLPLWWRLAFPLLALIAGFGLSGCQPTQNGSPQAAKAALPAFLAEAPATVRETYSYVLGEKEGLRQIPCYCGCGEVGHKNVSDCFIKEMRPDGGVVWEEMAYG